MLCIHLVFYTYISSNEWSIWKTALALKAVIWVLYCCLSKIFRIRCPWDFPTILVGNLLNALYMYKTLRLPSHYCHHTYLLRQDCILLRGGLEVTG